MVIGDVGPLFPECRSFGELLFEKLNGNPEFVGQIDSVTEKQATFAEIKERSVRCALWLKNRGVQRGDIVGVSTNNHPDCPTPLLGCLFICAQFYPMHYELDIRRSAREQNFPGSRKIIRQAFVIRGTCSGDGCDSHPLHRVKMQHSVNIMKMWEQIQKPRHIPRKARLVRPLALCKIVDDTVIGDAGSLFLEGPSLGELLFEELNNSPDIVGQIDSVTEKQATFAEIKERSVRCALWLKSHGVQHGDIVGVSTNNHPDCPIPLLGCLFICAQFYPMDYELDISNSRYFLSLTKPKVVFVNADMVEIMTKAAKEENLTIEFVTFGHAEGYRSFEEIIQEQDAVAVEEFRCTPISSMEEIAMLSLSSGSTGPPKAIMMSHRAFINNMIYNYSYAKKDQVVMCVSTLRWVTGIIMILRAICFHNTRIICDKYDEELICKLIEKYNVAFVSFQSELILSILKKDLPEKYDHLPSLRRMVLSGAAMIRPIRQILRKVLPHVQILFVYGISELCGVCTAQRTGDEKGSIGYMLKNVCLKVIDIDTKKALGPNKIGEFFWKSPYVMTGYYNNPQATKEVLDEDGWLRSGDFGYYDENGEIYIYDKLKETIKVERFMSYCTKIESLLQNEPVVREVAVVHTQQHIKYPIVFVSLVRMNICSDCRSQEYTTTCLEKRVEKRLIKLIADKLEDYKHLRCQVQFLKKLPHTDTGKIAKKKLKEIITEHLVPYWVRNL